MTQTIVDVNVPMALHPSQADEAAEHPKTGEVGRRVKRVLQGVYTEIGKYNDEVGAIRADPSLSDQGKHKKVAKLRAEVVDQASSEVAQLVEYVDRAASKVDQELTEALQPEHRSASETEIRDFARGLPSVAERMSFLMKAATEQDRETLNAVLQSRRYLSGFGEMAPDRWESFQNQLRRKLEPQLAEHFDVLDKLAKRLEFARSAVEKV